MLETRCVKYRCQHIVSFWLILLCKHFIKKESRHLISKNIVFIFFQSIIGETLNISTSTNKRTSMMIQTKQVIKYVLHLNIIIVFFHFGELGPCVYIKLKTYVTGP